MSTSTTPVSVKPRTETAALPSQPKIGNKVESPWRFLFDCTIVIAIGSVCFFWGQGQSREQIPNLKRKLGLTAAKLEEANATFTKKTDEWINEKNGLLAENVSLSMQLVGSQTDKNATEIQLETVKAMLESTKIKLTNALAAANLVIEPIGALPDGKLDNNSSVSANTVGKKIVPLEFVKLEAKMNLLMELAKDESVGHSILKWALLLNESASEKLQEAGHAQRIEDLFLQIGQVAPPQVEGEEVKTLIDLLQTQPTGNDVVDEAVNDVLEKRLKNLGNSNKRKIEAQKKLKGQLLAEIKKREELETKLDVLSTLGLQGENQQIKSQLDSDLMKAISEAKALSERLDFTTTNLFQLTNLISSANAAFINFNRGREQVKNTQASWKTENAALKVERNQLKDELRGLEVDRNATINRLKDLHGIEIARINNQNSVKIDALNRAFQNEIDVLKKGFDSHRIIATTTNSNPAVWVEGFVNRAQEHANRITSESEDEIRRIDGNLQNITGRRKEVDDRLDVVKKQAGDLLGILNTLNLDSNGTVSAAFRKKLDVLASKEEALAQEREGLLEKESALITELGEANSSHKEALVEKARVSAEIEKRWRELNKFFSVPSAREVPIGTLQAIEFQLKDCEKGIEKIQIGIELESKNLQDAELNQANLLIKKRKIERDLLSKEEKIDSKLAAELSQLLRDLEVGNKRVNELKQSLTLNKKIKDSDKKLLEKLKLAYATLKPSDAVSPLPGSLVLVPHGDMISRCAFMVKLVPEKIDRSFVKAHNEQIVELNEALRDANIFNKLAGFPSVTEEEKQNYLARINKRFESVFQGHTMFEGANQASYNLDGVSGKIVVYGMAVTESGKASIFVHELDATPNSVKLKPGIGESFSFNEK